MDYLPKVVQDFVRTPTGSLPGGNQHPGATRFQKPWRHFIFTFNVLYKKPGSPTPAFIQKLCLVVPEQTHQMRSTGAISSRPAAWPVGPTGSWPIDRCLQGRYFAVHVRRRSGSFARARFQRQALPETNRPRDAMQRGAGQTQFLGLNEPRGALFHP